ncbi:hypothetical protein ACQPU1_10065 [Clostridium paraputrificum]|uniref:hypothetical protein n=1 Tax=Clostridium paraputrificum TaxID=29363 RepID=UPI003D34AEF0
MKTSYNNIGNKYDIKNDTALITVLKKNGAEVITKIDLEDLDKVKAMGTWFAEWNKDFNNYIIQNISSTKKNKKGKPLKESLHSAVLNTNSKAPIKHINGDTLDNRKSNLKIIERNAINEYETIDEDTIAIILKDKFGNEQSRALISAEDLDKVIIEKYSWVIYKNHSGTSVIANTPEGRIHLDRVIMEPGDSETVHHINLNPLDNRRSNLENKEI